MCNCVYHANESNKMYILFKSFNHNQYFLIASYRSNCWAGQCYAPIKIVVVCKFASNQNIYQKHRWHAYNNIMHQHQFTNNVFPYQVDRLFPSYIQCYIQLLQNKLMIYIVIYKDLPFAQNIYVVSKIGILEIPEVTYVSILKLR